MDMVILAILSGCNTFKAFKGTGKAAAVAVAYEPGYIIHIFVGALQIILGPVYAKRSNIFQGSHLEHTFKTHGQRRRRDVKMITDIGSVKSESQKFSLIYLEIAASESSSCRAGLHHKDSLQSSLI